jgi:hypothetical protein
MAIASLRGADFTAGLRQTDGPGAKLLLKALILAAALSAGGRDPRPRDGLIRALDGESAALRRAVRQLLLALDAGEITELEAAHLIADAVDLYRRNVRLLLQTFEADHKPDAGDPASS